MKYKTKRGYTVSEILAVLTIIGVISAMVTPALVNLARSLYVKSALKQGYNTLSQAVNMASLNYSFTSPSDASKLMDVINEKMSITSYVNCSEDNCKSSYKNGSVGQWAVNEDKIAFKVETGTKKCADTSTINLASSTQAAKDATCLSVLIDAGCITKAKKPSDCSIISDDKNRITHNRLEGSQMRVFVGADGILAGNKNTTAAGIITAE